MANTDVQPGEGATEQDEENRQAAAAAGLGPDAEPDEAGGRLAEDARVIDPSRPPDEVTEPDSGRTEETFYDENGDIAATVETDPESDTTITTLYGADDQPVERTTENPEATIVETFDEDGTTTTTDAEADNETPIQEDGEGEPADSGSDPTEEFLSTGEPADSASDPRDEPGVISVDPAEAPPPVEDEILMASAPDEEEPEDLGVSGGAVDADHDFISFGSGEPADSASDPEPYSSDGSPDEDPTDQPVVEASAYSEESPIAQEDDVGHEDLDQDIALESAWSQEPEDGSIVDGEPEETEPEGAEPAAAAASGEFVAIADGGFSGRPPLDDGDFGGRPPLDDGDFGGRPPLDDGDFGSGASVIGVGTADYERPDDATGYTVVAGSPDPVAVEADGAGGPLAEAVVLEISAVVAYPAESDASSGKDLGTDFDDPAAQIIANSADDGGGGGRRGGDSDDFDFD